MSPLLGSGASAGKEIGSECVMGWDLCVLARLDFWRAQALCGYALPVCEWIVYNDRSWSTVEWATSSLV